MKGLVMEVRDGFAAVFREDGAVVKVRQSCQVGETIELPDLPQKSARNAWSAAMGALSAKLSAHGKNAADSAETLSAADAKTELSHGADATDIIADTVQDALDERQAPSGADTAPDATDIIADTVQDALDETVAEASEPTAVWDAPKAAPVNLWKPSEPVADAPERQEPETVWTAPDNPSVFSDDDLTAAATDITSDTIWDASEPGDAPDSDKTADAPEDSGNADAQNKKSRKTIPFPAGLHVLDAVKDRVSGGGKWRKSPWFRGAIAAAAALVILSGSVTYNTAFACSYVSIDVDESSIELSINRMGRVIAVNAISTDAAGLAQSIESDVKNKTVDDAVSLTMDALKDAGYLDNANGEIIASVTSNTEKRSMELTQTVAQTMEGNKKDGVKLYLMEASNGDRNAALTRKVSPGRYLIQRSGMDTLPARSNNSQSGAVAVSQPATPEAPDQPDLSALENLQNPALQAGTAALAGTSQPADGAATTQTPATPTQTPAATTQTPATTTQIPATTTQTPATTTQTPATTNTTSSNSDSSKTPSSGGNARTSTTNRNTGATSSKPTTQPTQTKPVTTPQPEPVAEPETPPVTQPEREPTTQPERESENRPAQSEPEPENRPAQSEPEPESRPAQSEPEPESRPTQSEPEPESRPTQPEPEPESRLNTPPVEPEPESRPNTPPVEPEPEQLWGNDRPATRPNNNVQPSGETVREDPGETTGHVVRNDPEPVQPSGPDDGETTAPVRNNSEPVRPAQESEPVRPAAPDAGETTRPANSESERPANNGGETAAPSGGGESERPANNGGGESASVLSPEPPKAANNGGESSAPSNGGESARPGGEPSGNGGGESSRPDESYHVPSGQPPF